MFDDFDVGQPWQVACVVGNLDATVRPFRSALSWEIRTGMAPGQTSRGMPIPGGSGGTVVRSGPVPTR